MPGCVEYCRIHGAANSRYINLVRLCAAAALGAATGWACRVAQLVKPTRIHGPNGHAMDTRVGSFELAGMHSRFVFDCTLRGRGVHRMKLGSPSRQSDKRKTYRGLAASGAMNQSEGWRHGSGVAAKGIRPPVAKTMDMHRREANDRPSRAPRRGHRRGTGYGRSGRRT